MKNFIDILAQSPLFNDIDSKNISDLLGCLGGKVKSYKKNSLIMAEGSHSNEFGLVLSGSVQMIQNDYTGNRTVVGDSLPTQLFAEAFACANAPSLPIDIVATEDCEIMFLESNRVLHTCSNACNFHYQIIFNLMKNMAEKNIEFHRKLQITSKRSTREKLMEYLSQQAKAKGNPFDIPYDRQTLADYLEVDRSGLSAEISKLRKEGILKNTKSHFELL